MNDIIEYNQWYEQLIEDCQNLLVEAEFAAKWTLIVAYHALGCRILQDEENFTKGGYTVDGLTQQVATSLNRSQRTIQYSIQCARMFPEVEQIPVGKNAGWRDVCKLLSTPKAEPTKQKEEYIRCKSCGSDNQLKLKCAHCGMEFQFEKKDIKKQ